MPDKTGTDSTEGAVHQNEEAHLTRDWCEHDLKRAISVAEEAGLQSYRVEVAPDGTISIVVGQGS